MFQIGDKVVYGVHGICVVADVEMRHVDGKDLSYLALEPVGQGGTKYLVPTHNAAAMSKLRYVLTPEQAGQLLNITADLTKEWTDDEGRRKLLFRELISSGDCMRLLSMVQSLYRHKAAQAAAGRKLHMCDENFLRDAERLLIGEISIVLELPQEQVKQTLRQNLTANV